MFLKSFLEVRKNVMYESWEENMMFWSDLLEPEEHGEIMLFSRTWLKCNFCNCSAGQVDK